MPHAEPAWLFRATRVLRVVARAVGSPLPLLHLADCADTGRWAAWSYPFAALTICVWGALSSPASLRPGGERGFC
jgi:hypothetical protein